MTKILFLDLDHTIIRPKSGKIFPENKDDWEFIPGILDRICEYINKDYIIRIVSNQGGIEKGYVDQDDFIDKVNEIVSLIRREAITAYKKQPNIDYDWCPLMKSYDRKPNPGMAYLPLYRHKALAKNCLMVGDMDSDREFAENVGMPFLHVSNFITGTVPATRKGMLDT